MHVGMVLATAYTAPAAIALHTGAIFMDIQLLLLLLSRHMPSISLAAYRRQPVSCSTTPDL